MADLAAKHLSYIARVQQAGCDALDVLDRLAGLRREWDESGYGSGPTALASFPTHLDSAALAGAMTTVDALATLRGQGHGTNLQKLRP